MRAHLGGLFGREVWQNHCIDSRRGGAAEEPLGAHRQHRVEVPHEHQWRVGRLLAHGLGGSEHSVERHSGRQGAFSRSLNRRPVGNRVTEGEAELDDVGAAPNAGERRFNRVGKARVAGHHVGDQDATTFFIGASKHASEPHSVLR
jgi:hypothetical protein